MTELKNLDALADQLYQEGMGRVKQESERLLSQTETKAKEILDDAKKKAEAIITKAKKEADKHQSAVASEINQKAKQAKQDLKNQIESLIVANILDKPIKDLLGDTEFVRDLILSSLEKWKEDGELELEVSIPKKLAELKTDLVAKIHASLPGLKISPTSLLETGFQVAHHGKGYILSFTEEDFKALLEPYLTEAVSKVLFESTK